MALTYPTVSIQLTNANVSFNERGKSGELHLGTPQAEVAVYSKQTNSNKNDDDDDNLSTKI